MAQIWYYTQNGQQCGPVDGEELNRLARSGTLLPDDLVWTEGMANWNRAGDTLEIFLEPTGAEGLEPYASSGSSSASPDGLSAGDILGPGEREQDLDRTDSLAEPEQDDRPRRERRRDRRGEEDLFSPVDDERGRPERGGTERTRRRRGGGSERDAYRDDRERRRPERGRSRPERDDDRDYDRRRRRRDDDFDRGGRRPRGRRRPPKRNNSGLVIGLVIGGVFLLLIIGAIIIGLVVSSGSSSSGGNVIVGKTQRGRLRSRGRVDYRVNLRKGKAYVFDVTSQNLDSVLELRDNNGRLVKQSFNNQGVQRFGNARLVYVANSTATYQVVVRPRRGRDSGSFEFTYRQAQLLRPGQSVNDRLSDGAEMLLYEVPLTNNRSYRFTVIAAGNWDTHMYLYDSQGNQSRDDDDGARGLNSEIRFRAFRTGPVYVGVTRHGGLGRAGGFTLSVTDTNASVKQTVTRLPFIGKRISRHDFLKERERDGFSVQFRAGRTYTIEMNRKPGPGRLNPWLDLYDSKGVRVRSDDNGGIGLDAKIVYWAPATATYLIYCSSCGNVGNGSYHLQIQEK
ncbi:MAG: DUF4339 domain-containing protein [Gemmataceae bacterium]